MTFPLLGKETYTRRIRSAGSYVDGDWVDGAESSTTVVGSWQQISGEEREDLPEGYRTARQSKFYTADRLNILDVATATRGDILESDGHDWEVITCRDYDFPAFTTRHYKYTLAQLGADE